MTKDEQENFERLCDKIANKVVARMVNLQEMMNWNDAIASAKNESDYDRLEMTDEDHQVSEMAKCMTLMNMFQDREEYEKCAIVKKMMKRLDKQLKR